MNLSRIFDTKSQCFTDLYRARGTSFFALYDLLDLTVQTPLHTAPGSGLFDWCLLLPHFTSYVIYRTWSFFAVPYGQWNFWHTVSECYTAFNWDFQLEIHQYLSSYAFCGWVLHSQLCFLSVWLFWGYLNLFFEGKRWCVMYSFFKSEEILWIVWCHAIWPLKSVYHLAGTLWSRNGDKQLAVSKLPPTFGQLMLQRIVCMSLIFSTWGQTCASQEPTNPTTVS